MNPEQLQQRKKDLLEQLENVKSKTLQRLDTMKREMLEKNRLERLLDVPFKERTFDWYRIDKIEKLEKKLSSQSFAQMEIEEWAVDGEKTAEQEALYYFDYYIL